jgi:hypothetical protein
MSLWLYRRAITRAASGELGLAAEARLRAHLARCSSCRAHYDACRSIADLARGGVRGAADERARLLRAIVAPENAGSASGAPVRAAGRSPSWGWAWGRRLAPWMLVAAGGAGALGLVLARRPASEAPPGEPEIVMRGGPAAADGPGGERAGRPELALRFYGRQRTKPGDPAAPVRLLGVLPGSGELRAGQDEEVQIAYVGLGEPEHLALLALDESGAVRRFYPPDGQAAPPAPLPPTREPRLLGARIGLGGTGGRLRLFALVSRDPEALARFERTLREHAVDPRRRPPPASFGGVLWVDR